jgi:hypothetical protein
MKIAGYSILLLGIVLACSACGPTVRDTLAEYQERYIPFQTAFSRLNALLPLEAVARDGGAFAGLDPVPVYDEKSGKSNTEILMDWQLPDSSAKRGNIEDKFDLLLEGDLWQSLRWMNPESSINKSERTGPVLRQTLERGLAYKYVAINSVLQHEPPVAADEKSFYSGSISLHCYFMTISPPRIIGSFEYRAATSRMVRYAYKPGEDSQKERQDSFAASSLWENARKELIRLLGEKTGGRFVLP